MNKFVLSIVAFFVLSATVLTINMSKNDKIIGYGKPNNGIAGMPIVVDSHPTAHPSNGFPKEDRGEKYRKFLAASVRIFTSDNISGSGTIVYYDSIKNEAYITSCGHLWGGSRTAAEVKVSPVNCKIIAWYHNDKKLAKPKTYSAKVLFWSNDRGYDSSLIKFTPDWVPNFFSIAPLNYNVSGLLNSCGCDSGGEVARYEVEVAENRGSDLITRYNSPRPGRSGGGLLSNDGYYVGICWGTSNTDGTGIGYFTPLKSIHSVYKRNGYDWLLNISTSIARKIPIYDKNNSQGEYNKNEYISFPDSNKISIPR